MPTGAIIKNNYKSTFTAMNVYCSEKHVATDTIYSYTPDIDDGSTCSQLFVVTK